MRETMVRRCCASCAAVLAGALLFARAGAVAASQEPIVVREEALPPGTPAGWHAVTFVIPGQVISGIATRFTLRRQRWRLAGTPLRVRLGRGFTQAPSHVLLPPDVPLPSGVRRLPGIPPSGIP